MEVAYVLGGASNPEVGEILHRIGVTHYVYVTTDEPGVAADGISIVHIDSIPADSVVYLTVSGTMNARRKCADALRSRGHRIAALVDVGVDVSSDTVVPEGAYLQRGVMIQAACTLGRDTTAHMRAIIAHECKIGECCFIGPGANLCGRVTVEDGAYIGAGVIVLPNVTIGKGATIGAGAVVTKSVPAGETWLGCPAHKLG